MFHFYFEGEGGNRNLFYQMQGVISRKAVSSVVFILIILKSCLLCFSQISTKLCLDLTISSLSDVVLGPRSGSEYDKMSTTCLTSAK